MNSLLEQLTQGQPLTKAESQSFFEQVVTGNVAPELLASVLTALKIKGENADEIAGAAVAIREHATPLPPLAFDVADCVGTGETAQIRLTFQRLQPYSPLHVV